MKLKEKNKTVCIGIILLTMVLAKIIQIYYLPEKYFYDSFTLLKFVEGVGKDDTSYYFAAVFFKPLYRFFKFSTITQWSIVIGIIGDIFTIYFISKYVKLERFMTLFFICAYVGLLNIYIFSLMKEFIQVIIYLFVFYVMKSEKIKKDCYKVFIIFSVFLLEGVVFRKYYFLTAVLFIGFYYVIKNTKIFTRKGLVIAVGVTFVLAWITLSLMKIVSVDAYNIIAYIRDEITYGREGTEAAQSLIQDWVSNREQPIMCALNILVNFFRFLFPIELLIKKNILYYLFFLAQILFALFLFKVKDKVVANEDSVYKIMMAILLAYLVVAAVYEPDYGSLIRHQTALFPICCYLYYDKELLVNRRKIKFII